MKKRKKQKKQKPVDRRLQWSARKIAVDHVEDRLTMFGPLRIQDSLFGSPRVQVSLILALTGFAGFLTSFLMLRSGITEMWFRYAVAVLAAYAVFLLLLRLWLALQRRSMAFDERIGDLIDVYTDLDIIPDESEAGEADDTGGGGSSGGGGGSGSRGSSPSSASTPPAAARSSVSSSDSEGSSFGDVSDIDINKGTLLIIAIVALIGGLIATLYIIYIAPVLMAEILVDGVLVAGLYKRVTQIERRYWLGSAVRLTIKPAISIAISLSVAGGALQGAAPGARSIGEVLMYLIG